METVRSFGCIILLEKINTGTLVFMSETYGSVFGCLIDLSSSEATWSKLDRRTTAMKDDKRYIIMYDCSLNLTTILDQINKIPNVSIPIFLITKRFLEIFIIIN